jgi:hypothetical protein
MNGSLALDPLFAGAYRRALEMTGPMLARYLKAELGRPLVARVTNVHFANTVTRWTRGTEPNRYALNRMQMAATILIALESSFEEPHGAARWIALDNPNLGFRAPIDALGDGEFSDVFALARAYAITRENARALTPASRGPRAEPGRRRSLDRR